MGCPGAGRRVMGCSRSREGRDDVDGLGLIRAGEVGNEGPLGGISEVWCLL